MKFKNVFWGLLLIILGTLLIGRNLGIVDFDWYNFLRLWPVIFILWGISLLPVREVYKITLLVLVLAASTWFVINGPNNSFFDNFNYTYVEESNSNTVEKYKNRQQFTIPYDSSLDKASLTLDAAAGSFNINQVTSDLLKFKELNNDNNNFQYTSYVEKKDGEARIKIKEDKDGTFYSGENKHKKVDIQLNSNPVWSINLDAGASAVNFDLTPFKVQNLDIDGGAGAFKIKLGDRFPETRVKIDAGASSISIKVPQTAGCDLRLSAILSGKNISGFKKISNGHYQTENYNSAKQKILMDVDAAVSSFTIIRN